VANHRAERRTPSRRTVQTGTGAGSDASAPCPTTPTGKRRVESGAGHHTGGRKRLIPGLPSAASLIGAAALAVAAVGATVSQPETVPTAGPEVDKYVAQASVLNASSTSGAASDETDARTGREAAISRDSQRQALADASEAELQQAAESQAKERNAALAALAASAEKYASELASNAWTGPLPPGSYGESASFGQCSSLWSNCHTGQDLSAPSGTKIFSVAAGTVTEAGYDGSYGNKTVVTTEDGTEIWYAHQTSTTVSPGQQVTPGPLIGYVGSTGNRTGPHLHLEVHPGAGDAVDPVQALAVRGVTLF